MADNRRITENLLEMYGRNDWMMRLNFLFFLHLSGLSKTARDARILDCGCGMGHLIRMLKAKGFKRTCGIDASPEMVEAARKLTGSEIVLSDVLELDQHFELHSLDVVIISDLFHHLPSLDNWHSVLKASHLVLKTGGRLIIREPFPTLMLMTLYRMSRVQMFHKGVLKARLKSFVEEDELLKYFFSLWPRNYKKYLAQHGFEIEKDLNWLVHRITSCRKRSTEA